MRSCFNFRKLHLFLFVREGERKKTEASSIEINKPLGACTSEAKGGEKTLCWEETKKEREAGRARTVGTKEVSIRLQRKGDQREKHPRLGIERG